MRKYLIIIPAIAALLMMSLASCAGEPESGQTTIFAMDTVMSLKVYGKGSEEAVSAAAKELYLLDALLSATDEDSEVSKINKDAGSFVPVSDAVVSQVNAALEVSERSGGAFDLSVLPLMTLWGFGTENAHVPSAAEIDAARKYVDYGKIEVSGSSVKLQEGMSITLGAIAKGYASQTLIELFKSVGIDSAMVSLGGNVQVLGAKPDGSKWRIAVQDPNSTDDNAGILELSDMAVVTSGGYQRYFEEDGRRYHHIIDPQTGQPAENGLVSVTIVCENGMMADALSTALFVLGEERAIDYWRSYGGFEAVLITDDGRVLVTGGLEGSFIQSGSVYILQYVPAEGGAS